MLIAILICLLLYIGIRLCLTHPRFGKAPSGSRLERIRQSPNYRNGQFRNLRMTPQFTAEGSKFLLIARFLLRESDRRTPSEPLPTVKTDLRELPLNQDCLVWFGHSSVYLQIDGKRILIDPVLSGHASPMPGVVRAFKGTDIYSIEDLPDIDYLLITHDHYDHLDYHTVWKLRGRVGRVFCGLGVGSHLERWGYHPSNITEGDWWDRLAPDEGFSLTIAPARHFSGRLFSRNNTLWAAFILETPSRRIYIGGDGGYDDHFQDIGNRFGPFDLALLENGQYNSAWRYIHAAPEEALQAAQDLRAGSLLPVHSCKFALGPHEWDEPLNRITELGKDQEIKILTPMIGERVGLDAVRESFEPWWTKIS
ncbi:MAG: MBL fold metallo-hydrolase [Bacteroidales bacterium]